MAALARQYFAAVGQPIAGVFEGDQDAPRQARIAVCVVTAPYVPIERALAARGFTDVWPGYDVMDLYVGRGHPLENGWYAPVLTPGDMARIAEVMSGWHDEVSRAHYLSFLAWRVLRQEWTFENVSAPVLADQHFIPEVCAALGPDEVFLDGGACGGVTALKFSDAVDGRFVTNGRFSMIHAVEPDPTNQFPYLGHRVRLHRIALSDVNGEAPFYGGFGVASRLARDTLSAQPLSAPLMRSTMSACPGFVDTVPTKRIDDLGVAPTFIKLHLEGGELAALRGATHTLQTRRPIVAANVDHNADGLWLTAAHLMATLDEYRFMFRNHVWCAAGSVLYAIPEERVKNGDAA